MTSSIQVSEEISRLLGNDPICGGRVTNDTVQAIAALAMKAAEPLPQGDEVERVARAIAGHFGPDFDDLPKNRPEQRMYIRMGGNPADNTQEDVREAARAAITAIGSQP